MPIKTVSLTANAVYQRPAYDAPPRVLVITNTDKTNPVFYSTGPGTIDAQSSQIPPGSAETFDGLDDVWMSTLSAAVSVLVDYKIGSRAFSPGSLAIIGNVQATVSGSVSITGTPNVNVSSGSLTATVSGPVQIEPTAGQPLDVSAAVVNINAPFILPGNKGNLFNLGSAQAIAANASFSALLKQDIRTYSAVDISLGIHCATQGTAGAPVTSRISFLWYDDAAGTNLIYQEDWYVWVANASVVNRAFGSIPMRGQYLTVAITNPSTIGITVDVCTITGTYRTPPYSTFRQESPSMTLSGVTVNPFVDHGVANNLQSINAQTPGTGLQLVPLPLYAGPVSYYWQVATAALLNQATLVDMSFATSGNIVAGTGQPGFIRGLANSLSTPDSQVINFPRAPVGLIINPAATSQIQFSAIGQQGY